LDTATPKRLAGLQSLGMARRARRAATGTDAAIAAIASGQAACVLLATDAGDNVTKKIRDKCEFYRTSCLRIYTKEEMGRAVGRSVMAVIAVTDPGFAKPFKTLAGEISGGVLFDETESI
jgi:ribosomal protein L7Ae-like RNA K-turn-binding protein